MRPFNLPIFCYLGTLPKRVWLLPHSMLDILGKAQVLSMLRYARNLL